MDWQTLLGQLGSVAIVMAAVGYVSKRGIEQWLAQRLQSHKASLDDASARALEELRSSLARNASDFVIYAQRRHDAIAQLFASLLRAENLANDFRAPTEAESEFADDRSELVVSRVTRARNDAYEAYYANVLYLPDELERLAKDTIFQFHDLLTEYTAPTVTPNTDRGKVRRELRSKMERLQTAARNDLARSRLDVFPAT